MHSIEQVRLMSEGEWAMFGVADLAFVKPIIEDGEPRYAIYAADGTRMAVVPDRDLAFMVVRQNNLEPASVH